MGAENHRRGRHVKDSMLPSKNKSLSSNPSTAKQKNERTHEFLLTTEMCTCRKILHKVRQECWRTIKPTTSSSHRGE
jgi:hypothetical protein